MLGAPKNPGHDPSFLRKCLPCSCTNQCRAFQFGTGIWNEEEMLGKTGERWDRTTELLKGAEPARNPGQGREKLFPEQLQQLWNISARAAGTALLLWGGEGFIFITPGQTHSKQWLPRVQNRPSSRNIPGSWHLEASFPTRKSQKLSVHSGDGANVGKLQLWEEDSRDSPSPGPRRLHRDPPGVPALSVPILLSYNPRKKPQTPQAPSLFNLPSLMSQSRSFPLGNSCKEFPGTAPFAIQCENTSLSPLMEHQMLLICGNNSRKKHPPH